MSKLLIIGYLQQINILLQEAFTQEEVQRLSLMDHLTLLLKRSDLQRLALEEQEQIIELLKRLFPEWRIEPEPLESPELVNIAYVLQKLDVVRSTFYRSINNKLLLSSGRIGGSPMYVKSEVDWLGAEALKLGGGKWAYSKLWQKKVKEAV